MVKMVLGSYQGGSANPVEYSAAGKNQTANNPGLVNQYQTSATRGDRTKSHNRGDSAYDQTIDSKLARDLLTLEADGATPSKLSKHQLDHSEGMMLNRMRSKANSSLKLATASISEKPAIGSDGGDKKLEQLRSKLDQYCTLEKNSSNKEKVLPAFEQTTANINHSKSTNSIQSLSSHHSNNDSSVSELTDSDQSEHDLIFDLEM